jgi:DNA mismatch repair protein MLH1
LKELLENSVDAGSTVISITVKEGGNKMLQVQDNGHGVREEDLAHVCERHTTSKLRTYKDLEGIGTLGFRGEALASITFVAHLTLTTMLHGEASHGLRATYRDGKMEEPQPTPCASVPGTIVTVEDLFYNVITRKKALKNSSEEYARILDVVGRYAVFKTGISFTCKKHGDNRTDIRTAVLNSRVDNVRAVYGAAVANNLLPMNLTVGGNVNTVSEETRGNLDLPSEGCEPGSSDASAETRQSKQGEKLGDGTVAFTLEALVSNASYSTKKTVLVLFINNRLVECPPLKHACEKVYARLLPKAGKPFLFMALEMPDKHVDVNVHPTKKEVCAKPDVIILIMYIRLRWVRGSSHSLSPKSRD